MVEKFTNFQRRMWASLCTIGVLRYYVDISKKGNYVIKHTAWGEFFFWIFWTNNIIKFGYVVLGYHKLVPGVEVHFLDQMSIWDWIFMTAHAIIECAVWFFKYPLYENLHMQWSLQEEIYRKLGRPPDLEKKVMRTDKINYALYNGIIIGCTIVLTIQFNFTPKYALNTYASITADTVPLRIIFSIHEMIFMFHGYYYQAFTMVLAQSYSVSYQHILEEMNQILGYIIEDARQGESRQSSASSTKNGETSPLKTVSQSVESSSSKVASGTEEEPRPVSKTKQVQIEKKLEVFSKTKPLIGPHKIVPGTEYNIMKLLDDYKKITISALYHNQWVGKVMGVSEIINFLQFVSDVFMIFQLLKEPDTDYVDVFFYMLDAVCGMTMMFRMLIILSRLIPQSEDFIQGLKVYATLNTPLKKQILKTIPSLRLVAAKLTGFSVTPESVPVGFDILFNWYICAAMWERPTDPSRRT